MDRSAGSNGAAASIRAHDITAMRLLFFKSMTASLGLLSRTYDALSPRQFKILRQTECSAH
jgi:hypothetical protein